MAHISYFRPEVALDCQTLISPRSLQSDLTHMPEADKSFRAEAIVIWLRVVVFSLQVSISCLIDFQDIPRKLYAGQLAALTLPSLAHGASLLEF